MAVVYRVIFYRDAAGYSQPLEYFRAMKPTHRAKAAKWLQLLEEHGPALPRPYADTVAPGIRELRIPIEHHQHRFLHSFYERIAVVTNGFLKNMGQVPDSELARSRRAFADWKVRRGWEDA